MMGRDDEFYLAVIVQIALRRAAADIADTFGCDVRCIHRQDNLVVVELADGAIFEMAVLPRAKAA